MRIAPLLLACALLFPLPARAEPGVDPAKVDAAIKAAFAAAPADWKPRLDPDATMAACSAHENAPPQAIFDEIRAREAKTVIYPPDGVLMGDWRKGEALAQSGYGLRFTDYPARRETGGNCYACHQLTRQEVSFGTMGPSLLEYGRIRGHGPEEVRAVYEKIYNSHATAPCSLMPRFGSNKVLTIDQIRHLVALLMDPQSPVNAGK
ncbi:MAG TPA: sulfur oxidation c-type cytochrome SoxX [Salinarimonas sp.]|nr:sulfur oxidation c-type cytochrome SoxX [Salinarimonas sp.]